MLFADDSLFYLADDLRRLDFDFVVSCQRESREFLHNVVWAEHKKTKYIHHKHNLSTPTYQFLLCKNFDFWRLTFYVGSKLQFKFPRWFKCLKDVIFHFIICKQGGKNLTFMRTRTRIHPPTPSTSSSPHAPPAVTLITATPSRKTSI